MGTVRWGIIGCGDVTEVKSGPGFQKAKGSALVAVMRRDGAKAADYAKRHGVPKWYDDAAKLVNDTEVDAVYVATPPSMHETYALMACRAGKPCYVEKPMARNEDEGRRMVEAFADAGVPLFVAFYRRALPRFVRARQIIQGGELGKIREASYTYADGQMASRKEPAPWRLIAEQSGGGLFVDMGSHAIDLLDFLLGPLMKIVGNARNVKGQYEVEDAVEMTFKAAGGVAGEASFNFSAAESEDEFRIIGERGKISFSCKPEGPLLLERDGGLREMVETASAQHVQQPLIQAIVEVLLGDKAALSWLSTGEVGLRTQIVMDQALSGFYGGREDGFWKRRRPAT
ncbi:MAG: Gfo/Idh/MocA family oxidoreductase [Tepidisphaeraceae bacterium]|jgi:predicted dehydrogenase